MSCSLNRRRFLALGVSAGMAACSRNDTRKESSVLTWGQPGQRDGDFEKPRAVGVRGEELYVIDTTGRVQVFGLDGCFVRKWALPAYENGTPTAVLFAIDGNVLIPDTHYSQILKYTPAGELIEQWGSYGTGPEEFIYPTDILQTPDGVYYITEYGMEAERVHVFDVEKRFVRQWGELGDAPGQLNRATSIDIDSQQTLYVADCANHRVQCFDLGGNLLRVIGAAGTQPGQIKFPYSLAVCLDDSVLVCEYGNNRVSRFQNTGEFMACYGGPGRTPGCFSGPRGIAVSPDGQIFVADTGNHRVQRFSLEALA